MKAALKPALPRGIEAHLPPKGATSILLVAPPYPRTARLHSLSYMAGTLTHPGLLERIAQNSSLVQRPEGTFFVRILDLGVAPKNFDLASFLARSDPSIIGVTSTTVTFDEAVQIAKLAKINAPNALRVVGGYHPSALPKESLLQSTFQIAVIGYGEETISELAMCLHHYGRQELLKYLAQIPGISFKNAQGQAVHNPRRNYLIPLDEYPFPHSVFPLHLFDNGEYEQKDQEGRKAGFVLGARGCPFSCKYCAGEAVHQRKVRFRSANNLLQEIRELFDAGVSHLMFDDETFTLHPEIKAIVAGLAELRQADAAFSWRAETRGDKIDPDLLDRMVSAGLSHMVFGIETADEALARQAKNDPTIRIDAITATMQAAKARGVSIGYNLLVGLPGQGWTSILRSANLLREHPPSRAASGILELYPGSEYQRTLPGSGQITITQYQRTLPVFDTLDLTRNEMQAAHGSLEFLIYYLIQREKGGEIAEASDFLLEAIIDSIRIRTIYDLLIRSTETPESRATLLTRAYKHADPIFRALLDEKPKQTMTFWGIRASIREEFHVGRFFEKYRAAMNISPGMKRTFFDPFLTSIKFANAYRLIGVPFSSIRFLIISLAITYTELLRNNNYQVKLVRVENEAATAGFIGENFKGKTTKDYNDLAPQLDFGSLLRGAVIDFFGLRISLDRQSETLILTASPSSL